MPTAKFLFATAFLVSIGAAPLAMAQSAGENADPARAKACNQVATDHQLAGETRKAFLQDCMKGRPTDLPASGVESCVSRAKKADQQKLKGEERKLFMSGCLKRS